MVNEGKINPKDIQDIIDVWWKFLLTQKWELKYVHEEVRCAYSSKIIKDEYAYVCTIRKPILDRPQIYCIDKNEYLLLRMKYTT